jgi:hypothetical protein
MAIYSGHPEKYAEMQDHIGEVIYDSHGRLMQTKDKDVENAKGEATMWVPLGQQVDLQKCESIEK